jgi:hypothetical protein
MDDDDASLDPGEGVASINIQRNSDYTSARLGPLGLGNSR